MSKIVLSTITNSQNLSLINDNFDKLEDALNNGVLYRNNPSGEPNQLNNDVDFNNFNLLNVVNAKLTSLTLGGVAVEPTSLTVINTLKITNNLSDVQSTSAARTNLGLGNVDNTSDLNKPISTATQTALNAKANLTANTFTAAQTISDATQSTSASTGSLVTVGGVGIAKDIYCGGSYHGAAFITAGSISATPISGSTGSFTTLSASSTVSGTGFSTYLASPPAIGSSTPNAISATNIISTGAANFNSLTAGATSITGALTVSQTAGIVGTTTNNNANAGAVGEVIASVIAQGSAVAVTNGVAVNVTSISLTAGDWDVFGAVQYNVGANVAFTYIAGSAGTTTAALNTGNFFIVGHPGVTASPLAGAAVPTIRVNIAATTTVYLVAQAAFGSGTVTAFGNITARRRR